MTEARPVPIKDLWRFELCQGNSADPADGACLLDAVSWMEYGKLGDHPACVCITLAAVGRSLNDMLPDGRRQRLVPYIPRLVGTVGSMRHELERVEALVRGIVLKVLPLGLGFLDGSPHADGLMRLQHMPGVPVRALDHAVTDLLRLIQQHHKAPWSTSGPYDAVMAGVGLGGLTGLGGVTGLGCVMDLAMELESAVRYSVDWKPSRFSFAVGMLEMARGMFSSMGVCGADPSDFVPGMRFPFRAGQTERIERTLQACMTLLGWYDAQLKDCDPYGVRMDAFVDAVLAVFDGMLAIGPQAEALTPGKVSHASDTFERAVQLGTNTARLPMPALQPFAHVA